MGDKITNVFVHLPALARGEYREEIGRLADKVSDAGHELCVQFDWFVQDPYHGPPPHLNAKTEKQKERAGGLGYAPFGWRRGWKWAVERMNEVLNELQPDYVLYGKDPHIRNGWDWATKPEYHYNDKLGMLHQAIYGVDDKNWHVPALLLKPRFILIPDTPGSPIQRRGILKVKKEFAGIDPLPVGAVQFVPASDPEEPVPDEPKDVIGSAIILTYGYSGWTATAQPDVDRFIATAAYPSPQEALEQIMQQMAEAWLTRIE